MSNILEYEGYSGSAEISVEDNCLHGKILFIRDLVTYQASTPDELKSEFVNAVDDYIQTCREYGKAPDKPCKGTFNVRISPELHRKAVIAAHKERVSLNAIISKSIEQYVDKANHPASIERHDHHHYHTSDFGSFTAKSEFSKSGEDKWTYNLVAALK